MQTDTIINIYALVKIIISFLAIFGIYSLFKDTLNFISRAYKDKLDNKKDIHAKDKDAEITQKIIEYKNTYPDVDLGFILKSEDEKDIENNSASNNL